MRQGRHDTFGAPADDLAGARELAGGSPASFVANASSAEVVAVKDGEASAPNAEMACSEYTPTPLFAFDVQGARVTVWPAQSSGNARNRIGEGGEEDDSNSLNHIVYLHVYDGDGLDVLSECQRVGCPPFTLVAIKPACWNDDLTPWECPGLFADDAPFAGHAQDQLRLLEEEIIPQVERECGKPNGARICRTVAGYSLAGLFATWAAFNSSAFSRIASASGSLWYPDFTRFVTEAPLARPIDCAYFSLGSKEAKTPSRLLRNVATGTHEVVVAFRSKGVPTQFESNPGNHFKEPALRMARGITWAISQQVTNR